ncbi:MAG: DUF1559 domain-containing protein, partial [Thermoguttaceae bacterium]
VAHEMAHFARRDHWFRWLEVLVLGIYWWFPVAWWARRQLHHAAEQCCDAWVVWLFPNGARCYARSLLETIDFLSRARTFLPVGASSLGQFHFHSLQRRFRMILSRSITRRMPWSMRITAVLLGLAILSFSARCVWGQGALAKAPEAKPETPATAESKADDPKPPEGAAKADDPKTPEATADTLLVEPADNKTPAGNALPTPAATAPAPLDVLPAQPSATPAPAGGLPVAGRPAAMQPPYNSMPSNALPVPAGGYPPAGQPAADWSPTPQSTNLQQRVQRLEAVTNQILQELRSLRRQNTGGVDYQMVPSPKQTWILGDPEAAQLSAVDEQIRALAAEMQAMQARMADLQAVRAKLGSQKPVELSPSTTPVPRATMNARVQSMNNLKQIALAAHNYHAANNTFPPAYIADKTTGKPLLSWRVAILPYIEQDVLYRQFHLDEPWDSEHNKKLIPRIPSTYRSIDRKLAPWTTRYLTLRHKDSAFPGKDGVGLADITDGTSNTIMVVEADDAHAVIWTKPEDLEFDPAKPGVGLTGQPAQGFNVALCDGSARFIPDTINSETLRNLVNRHDGNQVTLP